MRLVNDKQQTLRRIRLEPRSCRVEYGSLQRPHQHVLEHRIVRHQDVWRVSEDLVTREQLWILWPHHRANELATAIPPALSALAEPRLQIGLRRPLAAVAKILDESSSLRTVLRVLVSGLL